MRNLLSFDVEEAFNSSNCDETIPRNHWDEYPWRVEANTDRILALLSTHHVRATFFVLGWVAERHPNLVRRIDVEGHEIGAHTYWHRLLYDTTPDELREDLRLNVHAISSVTGKPVLGFRAPSYSLTTRSLWALDILREEGFDYDSSVYPVGFHPRYGLPDAPKEPFEHRNGLLEFPLPVRTVFGQTIPVATGAYFRIFPYSFTRSSIHRANRSKIPVTVNIHPWELDPEQPRLPMPRKYRWRHHWNLARTEPRLASLLEEFEFGPLGDTAKEMRACRQTGPNQLSSDHSRRPCGGESPPTMPHLP